jgi:uncharacterized membrane protein
MTIRMRAVAIMTALILPSLSLPAKAGLKVCNKTKETVDVAVAYVNPAGGVYLEGLVYLQALRALRPTCQLKQHVRPA